MSVLVTLQVLANLINFKYQYRKTWKKGVPIVANADNVFL